MKIVLALLAFLSPVAAHAATGVALDSKVLVERVETAPDGGSRHHARRT